MKFILALNSLGIGGTESYVLTVAEHLERLGHEPRIYTPEPGRGVEIAQERGLSVGASSDLHDDWDIALVQDAAVSFELADRCPNVPQIFVAHSESFGPQAPPQLAGPVAAIVAMNDRVATRLRSFAIERKIVRLRQPIDTERFLARGPLPEVPRRALVLSNNHMSDRLGMLESACAEAGLELARRGGAGGQTTDPRPDLAAADIVIGYGRSLLEAMACGRAAYVFDWAGGSGWVTADTYADIEADGFAGRDEQVVDSKRLTKDLAEYEPAMGPVNHDLIIAHHRATVHVQELVDLGAGLAVDSRHDASAPLEEMARLVRLEWRARAEVHGLLGENTNLRTQLAGLHEARVEEARELQRSREAALAAAHALADATNSYERTVSWRLTRPIRAAGRVVRKLNWRRRPVQPEPPGGTQPESADK